ncbi:MAG: hypothetical protein ABJL67_01895 [Sulfitobacter sp.]
MVDLSKTSKAGLPDSYEPVDLNLVLPVDPDAGRFGLSFDWRGERVRLALPVRDAEVIGQMVLGLGREPVELPPGAVLERFDVVECRRAVKAFKAEIEHYQAERASLSRSIDARLDSLGMAITEGAGPHEAPPLAFSDASGPAGFGSVAIPRQMRRLLDWFSAVVRGLSR